MQYFGFDRPSFGIKTYGFGINPDDAILALFAGGKQGAWYDPSDKSTMFQDVAGTIPVTTDGDPVALMKDKSGNGNHATQTVSTSRPVYKTDGILHWLSRDGIDDYFSVSSFKAPIAQPFSVVFADKAIDTAATYRFLFDSSSGTRCYVAKAFLSNVVWMNSLSIRESSLVGLRSGITEVSAFLFNGSQSKFRTNKESVYNATIGVAPIQDMSLFARNAGADPLKGNFYGCVLVSGSDYDNADLKQYLAAKAGVVL